MIKNYINLANAIVLEAVEDYRKALRTLTKDPSDYSAESQRESILKFFRSEYYGVLTNLDPESLIERLNKEAA